MWSVYRVLLLVVEATISHYHLTGNALQRYPKNYLNVMLAAINQSHP